MTDPLMFSAHAGAVVYVDHLGNPGDIVPDPEAKLERFLGYARFHARKRNRDGQRVALGVATELAFAIEEAACQRANPNNQRAVA